MTSSTDTQPQIVQLPTPRSRWWSIPLAAIGSLALTGVAVAGFVPASTFAEKPLPVNFGGDGVTPEATPFARVPAGAEAVNDRVSFGDDLPDSATRYEPSNDFFFVTITEPPQSALSWFVGRDELPIEFLTDVEKYGLSTPSERRQVSRQMMATSEQVAQFVALDRAGFEVELIPGEVVVSELVCFEVEEQRCTRTAPADEVLDAGDVLLEAAGEKLENLDDLAAVLKGRAPGDVVALTFQRGATTKTVDVELVADPDEPDRSIVGFVPVETFRVVLPFEVDIDTGEIGGPSAGLAFTLSLLDDLTEGDLTPGRDIAVTGTIGVDGTVGPIGGLPQKVEAVKQTGVDVFLVPASQDDLDAAMAVAGDDIEVIPVATVDEAIAELVRLGGDPVEPSS